MTQYQYSSHLTKTTGINVIRYKIDDATREHIYFSIFGKKMLIVIAHEDADLTDFTDYGLLKDLRATNLIDGLCAKRLMHSMCHGRTNYVMKCNLLRKELCKRTKLPFRFCGPELESILDPDVYLYAREMVGLYKNHTFIDFAGNSFSQSFDWRADDIGEKFNKIVRDDSSIGDKKLWTLFHGFVSTRLLIYIGSAPGDSWLPLMEYFNLEVLSVDGRELSGTHPRVTHVKKMIRTRQDFCDLIETQVADEPFDLLWDVRGEYESDVQYESMVSDEVKLINSICGNLPANCIRVCIKIRCANIDQYRLPSGGNFFLMPFLIERGKTELRYVAFRSLPDKFPDECVKTIMAQVAGIKSGIIDGKTPGFTNYDLFVSSMFMRVSFADFILQRRLDSYIDINLFCINRNASGRMTSYFQHHYPVVCSYFEGFKLNKGEHELKEENVLNFDMYSVVDSRVFIRSFIDGLFIIIPKNILIFRDERLTSQNYRLKDVLDLIMKEKDEKDYDLMRQEAALHYGNVFGRFPIMPSVFSNHISVSGHAYRFVWLYLKHGGISVLGYFDKIILSFYLTKNLSSNERDMITHEEVDWFPFRVERFFFENRWNKLWHSVLEWKSGVLAGLMLAESDDRVLSRKFDSFIDKRVTTKKLGNETFLVHATYDLRLIKDFKFNCFESLKNRTRGVDLVVLASEILEANSYEVDFDCGRELLKPLRFSKCKEVNAVLQLHFEADKFIRVSYVLEAICSMMLDHTSIQSHFACFRMLPSILAHSIINERNYFLRSARHVHSGIRHHYEKFVETYHPINIYKKDFEEQYVAFCVAMDWINSSGKKYVLYPTEFSEWYKYVDKDLDGETLSDLRRVFLNMFTSAEVLILDHARQKYCELIGTDYAMPF